MKVSVFTPTNNTKYLLTAYKELKDQDFYEWVILGNGGITINDFPKELLEDRRVKIFITMMTGSVGALKKMCCSYCSGDIFYEQDHDDLILPTAIEEIKKAFEDPEVVFAYSNCAYFMDKQYYFPPFSPETGWVWKPYSYNGKELRETIAPEPHPSNCSTIHWQPDHLRAFRKTAYDSVGGYDENLELLDDQDLMCKLFTVGKFYHINKCLYLYYVNLQNTFIKRQDEIAKHVDDGKKKYLSSMCEAWAKRENLKTIVLSSEKDFNNYDEKFTVEEFLRYDLDESSTGLISLFNNFVNISDKEKFLSKLYKTLIPGGMFLGIFPESKNGWNKYSFDFVLDKFHPDAGTTRFYSCLIDKFSPAKDISFLRVALVALKKDENNNEIFRPHGKISI
jgi:hypothetical protein